MNTSFKSALLAVQNIVNLDLVPAFDDIQSSDPILGETLSLIDSKLDSISSTLSSLLGSSFDVGMIAFFGANTVPDGWLKADGSAVSRTTYASLFSYIGTTFGAGDGSTTFNLPDVRGEFIRGFDSGRGVDAGRVFGSVQGHAFASHNHALTLYGNVPAVTNAPAASGSYAGGTAYTSSTGGNETRPRNVAYLACIKF